jgi:hypothetical protein
MHNQTTPHTFKYQTQILNTKTNTDTLIPAKKIMNYLFITACKLILINKSAFLDNAEWFHCASGGDYTAGRHRLYNCNQHLLNANYPSLLSLTSETCRPTGRVSKSPSQTNFAGMPLVGDQAWASVVLQAMPPCTPDLKRAGPQQPIIV